MEPKDKVEKKEAGCCLAINWIRTTEGQELLSRNIDHAKKAAKARAENMSVNLECLLRPVTL